MEELKPCPFCGGAAHLIVLTSLPPMYQVAHVCKVVAQGAKDTAEEAIEAWNTRHERTCTFEQASGFFLCSECGEMNLEKSSYCRGCGAKVVKG